MAFAQVWGRAPSSQSAAAAELAEPEVAELVLLLVEDKNTSKILCLDR